MLSGIEINKQRELGNIVIEPYNPTTHLGPNSYDVTLGPWIIRHKYYGDKDAPPIDISDEQSIQKMFLSPEKVADVIILRPFERILCHTYEIIGTIDEFVMELQTRSTTARWSPDVCGSAGFGDVGFVNKWTMELSNDSWNPMYIPVGGRVGQAQFSRVEGNTGLTYDGSYNYRTEIWDKHKWKPEDMLPKTIKREIMV